MGIAVNKVLSRKPPGSFWAISIVILVWNAIGVFQYVMLTTASAEQLATSLSAAELAIFQSTPGWVTGAFAIAVFGGLGGAIGLLARKSWARTLFIVSLIAVLAQHFWTFFLSGYLDIMPISAAIFPIIVVIVGMFQIWYARNGIRRGWLR